MNLQFQQAGCLHLAIWNDIVADAHYVLVPECVRFWSSDEVHMEPATGGLYLQRRRQRKRQHIDYFRIVDINGADYTALSHGDDIVAGVVVVPLLQLRYVNGREVWPTYDAAELFTRISGHYRNAISSCPAGDLIKS